jgi:hypothetical protein
MPPPVGRQAHNLKVTGSNPVPATSFVITRSPSRSNRRDGLAFLGNAGVTEQVRVLLWSGWTGARPFWEKVTGSNHVRRATSEYAIGATRRRFPAHHTILVMYGDKAKVKCAVIDFTKVEVLGGPPENGPRSGCCA